MRLTWFKGSLDWRYVFGELLLIVAGVTLALMATSFYESWQDKQNEKRLLQQISLALEADMEGFKIRYDSLLEQERELTTLLGRLRRDELGPESNGLFPSVRNVEGSGAGEARSGPYEVLKAQGYSLVSNESLRISLVDLYEKGIRGLESANGVDSEIARNQVWPYMWMNFRSEGPGLVPVNGYAALDSDAYFQNLVEQKLNRLRDRLLPRYESTIALIEDVLTEIRNELGDIQQ